MSSTRFFVANLPSNTTEQQLAKLFRDYGTVKLVELKNKEDPLQSEIVKVIAFVTLQIRQSDVKRCIDALNWERINGAKISVSVAKESFLDRLKREREEAEALKNASNNVDHCEARAELVLPRNVENSRKVFTDDELKALENDDILLISKKRAASSLHNGRIIIQSCDAPPLHVIETAKKGKKNTDGKESVAEQKRKKSQNEMSKQYKENKSIVQQALAGMNKSQSNKIIFSDAEENDESLAEQNNANVKVATKIFESDEEDAVETNLNLELKPEYFGKKGAKLLEMQSKQSLDPRFRIDAKFLDDEEEQEENEMTVVAENNDCETERNWQMGILETVVGAKIDTADSAQKAARNKRMLRYDPAKEEHQKLLRTTANETPMVETITVAAAGGKRKRQKEYPISSHHSAGATVSAVSKEHFYMVTDTLTESLKTRGDGFSLLNMFGSAQVQNQRNDDLKKVSDAKIPLNKLDKNTLNPFGYDSSTDEEVEKEETMNESEVEATDGIKQPHKRAIHKQKTKIVVESFFISCKDVRLKEGAKFFRCDKKITSEEDYEAVRNRLKLLIRKKINKTKKNLARNVRGGVVQRRRGIKKHH